MSSNIDAVQDSEFTSQIVNVDRLYHRQLITRLAEIDNLEKKWNCKIVFPSTEQASDEVTVTGPQWQVPMCVDEFLVCLLALKFNVKAWSNLRLLGYGSRQP